MGVSDPREEGCRGFIGCYVERHLTDNRAGVRSRIDDLEERHPRTRESGEDRPRNRRPAAMPGEQGRVHSEDALAREVDERVADELRPPDDEDQLGLELANCGDRLLRVYVTRLVDDGSEPLGNFVERALAGAVRVARAGQRHDTDYLRANARSRL